MQIETLEALALDEDREKALENLIPGTDEHYFYRSLFLQHKGRKKEVVPILKQWIERHGRTRYVQEIETRQALLDYEDQPKKTLSFLKDRLGLSFNHQQQVEGKRTSHPTKLQETRYSWDRFQKAAFRKHRNSLDGFADSALPKLLDQKLEVKLLRRLLDRLEHPDHPGLVDAVVRELEDKKSGGFGKLRAHGLLTEAQLIALVEQKPNLAADDTHVRLRIDRLRPGADVDWVHDEEAKRVYLERLWEYVKDLHDVFNTLKVQVLYQLLHLDRQQKTYDRDRFMAYLKLPRRVDYVRSKYLEGFGKKSIASLDAGPYAEVLICIGDDEELVRDYLMHFFVDASDYQPFAEYVSASLLKRWFAIAKIENGVGDFERWYALLDDPSFYRALKDEVRIVFAPHNPRTFAADDPLALDVDVKNVGTLVVKLFEINTEHSLPVDTSVDLDGLEATEEQVHHYQEPAERVVRRRFSFEDVGRGTYVVELIGNGRSSRALIQKGDLKYVMRKGSAGHVLTILGEKNELLEDAVVLLDGNRYDSRDGQIVIPYTTRPRSRQVLLRHGSLSVHRPFQHEAEHYHLEAGFYIDREALLSQEKANLVIRPSLLLNQVPVSLKLLEDVLLTIRTTDRFDVDASKTVSDLKLADDQEATYELQVPADLASIRLELKGKVRSLSEGRRVEVRAEDGFNVNGIDVTEILEAFHLERLPTGYTIRLLGKTGEPRAQKPVEVTLHHRDFVVPLRQTLQTDDDGRITLGELSGIRQLEAQFREVRGQWTLWRDRATVPETIHLRAGKTDRIPYLGTDSRSLRSAPLPRARPHSGPDSRSLRSAPLPRARPHSGTDSRSLRSAPLPRARPHSGTDSRSLLERCGTGFRRTCNEALELEDGFLRIGPLERGDYALWLPEIEKRIEIVVAESEPVAGWLVSGYQQLELSRSNPLQIVSVEEDDQELAIEVAGGTSACRVHLSGTRFMPEHSLFDALRAVRRVGLTRMKIWSTEAQYLTGRDIGEEYRYILERRYAKKRPGNLLPRAGLLLNPWSVRKTDTGIEQAAEGGKYAKQAAPGGMAMGAPGESAADGEEIGAGFVSLDFLPQPARTWFNLRPDQDGVVRLSKEALEGVALVRVLASDVQDTAERMHVLRRVERAPKDLRLQRALDRKERFTEQKQVTTLPTGASLLLDDIRTAKLQIYDTVGKVFQLFKTLSHSTVLEKFRFVTRWHQLDDLEKRKNYSEHACHELSLFLSRKDPKFFAEVVQPYLASKMDRTFLDDYLLEKDLSAYLSPWAYSQLNIVEKILLARRIEGERGPTERHVKDRWELVPRNIEQESKRFRTALGGGMLDTGDALGFKAAQSEVRTRSTDEKVVMRGTLGEAKEVRDIDGLGLKESKKPSAGKERSRKAKKKGKARAASFGGIFEEDQKARDANRPLYRKADKTEELAENNYYELRIAAQGPDLIGVSRFWIDFATHAQGPFLSEHVTEPTTSFAEMMLALAVLDLPFDAEDPEVTYQDAKMTMTSRNNTLVFHEEIKPAALSAEKLPILVTQSYLRHDDRVEYVAGEARDKYVRGQFLVHVPYTCQVILTNPTSALERLQVLLQVPQGAIPIENGFITRGQHVELQPFATERIEYSFYFPEEGKMPHYPVQAAKEEAIVAFAEPTELEVVRVLTTVDTSSWAYVSQQGSADDVITFLEQHNVEQIDLERIAWRMKDRAFFERAIACLGRRHVFAETLWSYAVHHDDAEVMRTYLSHSRIVQDLVTFSSPLLAVEPISRRHYEHLEYLPLINARSHRLGSHVKILNTAFDQQYRRFLDMVARDEEPSSKDLLAATYYFLLQDRVEEAEALFSRVDRDALETRLQLDYLDAFLAFFSETPSAAKAFAEPHANHPVDRWRKKFSSVLALLDEAEEGDRRVVDDEDRDQQQAQLAATQPSLDLAVEDGQIKITYQCLDDCRVSYYPMDVELLFSRRPFMEQETDRFLIIKPRTSVLVELPEGQTEMVLPLPKELTKANVIVEVAAQGMRKTEVSFAHDLHVQLVAQYGQVTVRHKTSLAPLPKTYVKVYARHSDGAVRFYKDGYTDLRGVFDYATLSTDELDRGVISRFAMLVMSASEGAVIREAAPPSQ